MKSVIVVFLLYTSAAFAAAFQFPKYIPDESCDCRPLLKCFSALSKLKSSHKKDPIKHKAFTKYLNIINCGYTRNEPLICCPREIPDEVIKILDNKKYWTKAEEQSSIKKLKYAYLKDKSSSVPSKTHSSELLKNEDQFLECGKYLWREDSFGNGTLIGEYPWLALLEYDTDNGKKFLCGGALISNQHILTAARCVTSRGSHLISVILGEYDTSANPECMPDGGDNEPFCVDSMKRYDIDYSVIHDEYNDGITHREVTDDGIGPDFHDIALIKLKEKVQLTDYVQPICLPLKRPKTRRYKVSGWGRSFVPDNKGFDLKSLSYLSQCTRAEYERRELDQIYEPNEHICAAAANRGEKPCIVDSGGPLMAVERKENGIGRMTIFGVSYMEMTCENRGQPKDLPGIFTNVYNYKDWIVKHMKS